jgi:hypothetical protein
MLQRSDYRGKTIDGPETLNVMVVNPQVFKHFLADARFFQDLLSEALPEVALRLVPDAALLDVAMIQHRVRALADDPRVADALLSYRARSGV